MSAPPAGVERDYPLARLTTVRTGGAADFFAAPGRPEALVELLALGRERGRCAVGVVGSGSNLLVADDGFRGLAIKLDGALADDRARRRARLLCGGGARLPSAAAKAAGWGLSGLEFGVNIPGTAGGAVRMNANAYGGAAGRGAGVGRGRDRAPGPSAALPTTSASPTATPTSRAGEVVSRASLPRCAPATPTEIRATLAAMREPPPRGAALGDQDLRLDLQEPRRRARRGPLRRAAAGGRRLPRPRRRRRPLLREARQLRRELRRARPPPTCWR